MQALIRTNILSCTMQPLICHDLSRSKSNCNLNPGLLHLNSFDDKSAARDSGIERSMENRFFATYNTFGLSSINCGSVFYGMTLVAMRIQKTPFAKGYIHKVTLRNDITGGLVFSGYGGPDFGILNSIDLTYSTRNRPNGHDGYYPLFGLNIHVLPFKSGQPVNISPTIGVSLIECLNLTYGYSVCQTGKFAEFTKHNICVKLRIGVFLSNFDK